MENIAPVPTFASFAKKTPTKTVYVPEKDEYLKTNDGTKVAFLVTGLPVFMKEKNDEVQASIKSDTDVTYWTSRSNIKVGDTVVTAQPYIKTNLDMSNMPENYAMGRRIAFISIHNYFFSVSQHMLDLSTKYGVCLGILDALIFYEDRFNSINSVNAELVAALCFFLDRINVEFTLQYDEEKLEFLLYITDIGMITFLKLERPVALPRYLFTIIPQVKESMKTIVPGSGKKVVHILPVNTNMHFCYTSNSLVHFYVSFNWFSRQNYLRFTN